MVSGTNSVVVVVGSSVVVVVVVGSVVVVVASVVVVVVGASVVVVVVVVVVWVVVVVLGVVVTVVVEGVVEKVVVVEGVVLWVVPTVVPNSMGWNGSASKALVEETTLLPLKGPGVMCTIWLKPPSLKGVVEGGTVVLGVEEKGGRREVTLLETPAKGLLVVPFLLEGVGRKGIVGSTSTSLTVTTGSGVGSVTGSSVVVGLWSTGWTRIISFLRAISAAERMCPSGGGGREEEKANSVTSLEELKVDDWTVNEGRIQNRLRSQKEGIGSEHGKATSKYRTTPKP